MTWGSCGYVPADGTGDNGCLMVLEAAGADEAIAGIPTVGKAGHYLWSNLAKEGIARDGWRIHNVLSCQPYGVPTPQYPEGKPNLLVGQFFEKAVIDHCAANLDQTIKDHVAHCARIGKTPTILALGKTAFKRLMKDVVINLEGMMKKDYQCYPHWHDKYGVWVIAGDHPSHLMQGAHHKFPILSFAAHRALEIANTPGFRIEDHKYVSTATPSPEGFREWIAHYLRYANDVVLSYDIETPYKQDKGEDELAKDELADNVIIRVAFCYQPGDAVSVPWNSYYMEAIRAAFASPGPKVGWNSWQFDDVRIMQELPIEGDRIDAMLAWHVLNTSMDKRLGFVTPFYAQSVGMWKHLDAAAPAYYNAKDADMALRCWLGIKEDLKRADLWHVFNRHITEVHRVFKYMGDAGVVLDQTMRSEAETRIAAILRDLEVAMEEAIPASIKRYKVYKKDPTPEKREGLIQLAVQDKVKRCAKCGALNPKKAHFKLAGKKAIARGEVNPCTAAGAVLAEETLQRWAKREPFKLSKKSLLAYQTALKHKAILTRKEKKITFDETAITRLQRMYPGDALYPLILQFREKQKLLSTYIGVTDPLSGRVVGGMPVAADGRVHTIFTSNPSTLRSASQNPNLQNLPRPTDEFSSIIRNLITASEGHTLYARDFSGIEAVLVGYEAMAPGYIRLARRDVHTYYTVYALYELEGSGRILANDLPLLSWDDDKLFTRLNDLKGQFKKERNSLYKHLVHAANFMQSAMGARDKIYAETGHEYEVSQVKRIMDVYFGLFPEIRKYHATVLHQAEKDGYLRNAFGYIHRFASVFNYERVGERWEKKPNPDVANKVVAFKPQSNAAGIIKESMLRLHSDYFDEVGRWLRLLVHDELFFDCPTEALDKLDQIVQTVMESPITQMPLPLSYGMGPYLTVLTEAKKGFRWGSMK
jgi:uracil-DNA glycosylase family 4